MRHTDTLNIKPTSISANSIKPSTLSTIEYAKAATSANNKTYGSFKYGAKTYGESVVTSAGQKMPKLDTREI